MVPASRFGPVDRSGGAVLVLDSTAEYFVTQGVSRRRRSRLRRWLPPHAATTLVPDRSGAANV